MYDCGCKRKNGKRNYSKETRQSQIVIREEYANMVQVEFAGNGCKCGHITPADDTNPCDCEK